MQKPQCFNSKELLQVDDSVKVSEEMVNNYFKLSSGQWLKNKYDIKTAKDLASHECINGPVAQVIKYEGRKKDIPLGSSAFSFYKICLQDDAILSTVAINSLSLGPFLLYILTHELVHVVRFSKFEQRYEKKNEAELTLEEEKRVHLLTYEILKSMASSVEGVGQVFEFYSDWITVSGGGCLLKKLDKPS
jgi:hypothetical protein